MCLLPAAVHARLTDARSYYESAGPVGPADTATFGVELTELLARSVVHGQTDLALGLGAALSALDRLRVAPVCDRPAVVA